MYMSPITNEAPTHQRITVMQGMAEVSSDPNVVLTTVLGSCVAACLFDPLARVGGMNHFLLAEPHSAGMDSDTHYGTYLMELLINTMLQQGALKSRMKAHVYGGGNLHQNMQAIGTRNWQLAERFLNTERITISHSDIGGNNARRVDFLAATGKARCRHVDGAAAPTVAPVKPKSFGDVEFF